jgi:hypothetical protein
MEPTWSTFAGVALGIGLAAATGFRVFLPLLIAGLAAGSPPTSASCRCPTTSSGSAARPR